VKWLAFVLGVLGTAAYGAPDNPCNLPGPKAYYNDLTAFPASSCAPGPRGDGTLPTIRFNGAGATVWWYCKGTDGIWRHAIRAATYEVMTPAFMAQLTADLTAASTAVSPTTELNLLTRARINTPLSDQSLVPVHCPWIPTIWAGTPPREASADGTLVPPALSLADASGAVWTIVNGWAVRSGVQTNGHATQILLRAGAVYVKSPTGGIWWKYTGPNTWLKMTTAMP
jgi:hypothetical protein